VSVDGDDLADLLRVSRPEPRQWETLAELDLVADGVFRRADAERLQGYWGSLAEFEDWLNLQADTDPYTDPTPDTEV